MKGVAGFVSQTGLLAVVLVLSVGCISLAAEESSGIPEIPVKNMVTMVDLGAKKCIPCKMMAPIMESLEKEYKDKAAIHFIDVWEHPDQSRKFGIRSIPTQIFYDREGNEVHRHEGFLDKESIEAKLSQLGARK